MDCKVILYRSLAWCVHRGFVKYPILVVVKLASLLLKLGGENGEDYREVELTGEELSSALNNPPK